MCLAQEGDGGAAVEAVEYAGVGGELAHAVDGAGVEAGGAVGLCLQADADVLYGAGEGGVGDAGKGARGVVLAVGEGFCVVVFEVAGFEGAAGVVEGAELDGDLKE